MEYSVLVSLFDRISNDNIHIFITEQLKKDSDLYQVDLKFYDVLPLRWNYLLTYHWINP